MPPMFPGCLGQQEKQTHKNTICGFCCFHFLHFSRPSCDSDRKSVLIFSCWVCPCLHQPPLPPSKKILYSEGKFCKDQAPSGHVRQTVEKMSACRCKCLTIMSSDELSLFTQFELFSWQNPTGWSPFSFTSMHPAPTLDQTHKQKCVTITRPWKTTNGSWLLNRMSWFSQCRHHPSIKGGTNSVSEAEGFRFKPWWAQNLKGDSSGRYQDTFKALLMCP